MGKKIFISTHLFSDLFSIYAERLKISCDIYGPVYRPLALGFYMVPVASIQ